MLTGKQYAQPQTVTGPCTWPSLVGKLELACFLLLIKYFYYYFINYFIIHKNRVLETCTLKLKGLEVNCGVIVLASPVPMLVIT